MTYRPLTIVLVVDSAELWGFAPDNETVSVDSRYEGTNAEMLRHSTRHMVGDKKSTTSFPHIDHLPTYQKEMSFFCSWCLN